VKKLRRLSLERVPDELQGPSRQEQGQRDPPQSRHEEPAHKDDEGNQNGGNAEGMAEAVDRMLVAGGVLRDPFPAGAIPEHRSRSYYEPGEGWQQGPSAESRQALGHSIVGSRPGAAARLRPLLAAW
jgi:hypothetical protein